METITNHRYFSGYIIIIVIAILATFLELGVTKGQNLTVSNLFWSVFILTVGLMALPIQPIVSNLKATDSRDIMNLMIAAFVIVCWFCLIIRYAWRENATVYSLTGTIILFILLSILFFKN